MSDIAALIADLVAAEVSAELIGRVAAALASKETVIVKVGDENAERRRAADRQRKADARLRKSAEVVGTPQTDPLTPSPPRDIINPPIPSPPSVSLRSTEETRDKRACAAREAAGEFERFWSIWPHKVGKPAAAKAFFKVRGEVEAILAGVPRYVAETEAIGRPWLNPSTFLNQRRWEDAPAPAARAGPRAPPAERRNPAFAAYEELMAEGLFNAQDQHIDPFEGTTLDLRADAVERRGFG